MKRFFTRLGRLFWSWGFLKFVLWTATIIVLFYAEEDWRGARAWASTKAKWEAKGESFDYAKFVPPPVPDNENLAALPVFQPTMVEYTPGKFTPEVKALEQATRDGNKWNSIDLPTTGRWTSGELADVAKLRVFIATSYAKVFKDAVAPSDPLAQFDAVFPFVGELRTASETRPFCRFPEDYSIVPPASRALGTLAEEIRVSKIFTLHALLALDEQQSDLALEDLKLNQKLALGAARDPTLVASLFGMGMTTVGGSAIFSGLAKHQWNDAQLAEIQRMLEQFDFLAMYQFAFRAEAAVSTTNITYFQGARPNDMYRLLGYAGTVDEFGRWSFDWPSGWWDTNKSLMADYILGQIPLVDPQQRRVFPEAAIKMDREVESNQKRWDAQAPWRIWYTLTAAPLYPPIKQFPFVQTRTDMARIACALERYRLAHGGYPKTLAELAPAYIDAVPHDIMNGEPYHYRLNGDGTFTLYSVGWNEVDDGGKMIFKKDNPGSIDYEQGDWVWPTAK